MNRLGGTRIPADFSAEYQSRTDEDLLQLWVERSELLPEAEAALQNEIGRRGLGVQAATTKDRRVEDDSIDSEKDKKSDHRLAPAVAAWGPSIAWYWLRELRLRHRTNGGIPIQARVESTLLTRAVQGRGGGGRRAELRYSYDCQGPRTGRTVRDFTFGDKTGKALAFGRKPGDAITVLVDPTTRIARTFPQDLAGFSRSFMAWSSLSLRCAYLLLWWRRCSFSS